MDKSKKLGKGRRFSFSILLFVFTITTINYLDRSAISFAILPLREQLGISNEEYGWIASAFGVGYLCMCVFGGVIVDRFNPIKVWPLFVFLWSLCIFGLGLAQGFLSLLIFRLLLGVAEAVHFPALLRILSDTMDAKWRAKSISIGLLGVPVASLIGAPVLSLVIVDLGWRWMLFLLSILGMLWAFCWYIWIRQKGEWHKQGVSHEKKEQKSFKHLWTSKVMWGNAIQFFSLGYVIFFSLMWLPGFFEERFHLPILKTGFMITLPWAVAAIAVVLGGWFSDWLKKKTGCLWISRALVIGSGLFLAGISFSLIAFTTHVNLALIFVLLGLGFAFFTNAPIFSINADLFPKRAGTAQGIITLLFAIAGIVAPALTGIIVQVTHLFEGAFFIIGFLSLLSLLVTFTMQKKALKGKDIDTSI